MFLPTKQMNENNCWKNPSFCHFVFISENRNFMENNEIISINIVNNLVISINVKKWFSLDCVFI